MDTITDSRKCRDCGDLLDRNPAITGPPWLHSNGVFLRDGHGAWPVPQCPQCGSEDYRHDQTDAWADYLRCGSCGQSDRMSLGD